MQKNIYYVEGTTCRSCEILIESEWKKLPGVRDVKVNSASGRAVLTGDRLPKLSQLQAALRDTHYIVRSENTSATTIAKPSFQELVGLFSLVLFLGFIVSRLGLFNPNIALGKGLSFGAVFVIGLIAASSSCIAVVGGLLISSAAKFNERYANATRARKMRPVILFVLGRIVSYTMLGGLLGVVGKALTPSPIVTATLILLAALYMIVMGLDMLHLAPRWLKQLLPGAPKRLSHTIVQSKEKEHPLLPLLLGAATFFLPCGFTQALQIYALTTGSFWSSAQILLAFSLGTAPALLALGYASSSIKGKLGQWFFKFSGALVIVLGLWNVQNGLSLIGYPLSFGSSSATVANTQGSVTEENGVQIVRMKVDYEGYHPSRFTVRAGQPVRWEVDGTNAGGCASVLVSRSLGIEKLLESGINTFTFTPKYKGQYAFNCSMGMYRGSFTVN